VDRLRAVFDADLARLGDWLGLALDCDHFSEIVLAGPSEWAGLKTPERGVRSRVVSAGRGPETATIR
jgi:hypothetical protein